MATAEQHGGDQQITAEQLDPRPPGLEHHLPAALLATILSFLDARSLCSAAATCRSLRSAAAHALSFLPSLHLLEIAAPIDLLRPLLPNNPYLRSLKLDCRRLDNSAAAQIARPSLHELVLHNCENMSGRILAEIGSNCHDLRCLSLSDLADKIKWSNTVLHFSDLEILLNGCSELEVKSAGA